MWRNETAWSKRHTRPTLRGEAGPSRRQDPASPVRKEQDEMKLNIRNKDGRRAVEDFGLYFTTPKPHLVVEAL